MIQPKAVELDRLKSKDWLAGVAGLHQNSANNGLAKVGHQKSPQ
jgi:hypothetical protein